MDSAQESDSFETVESIIGEPIWSREVKREWLIEPLIERGVVTVFVGDAGGGKSFFALDLARSIAQGRLFAGLPTRQAPVLYLDRENSDAIIKTRLSDVLKFSSCPGDERRFMYWGGWAAREPAGPASKLVKDWVRRHPGCVVILDSLIRFTHEIGEENSATDNAKFNALLRELISLGATPIMLHHTGRSGEWRGSSDIKAYVSTMYEVRCKTINVPDPENPAKSQKVLDSVWFVAEKSRGADIISPDVKFFLRPGGFVVKNVSDKAEPEDVFRQMLDYVREQEKVSKDDLKEKFKKTAYDRHWKALAAHESIESFVKDRRRIFEWVGGSVVEFPNQSSK